MMCITEETIAGDPGADPTDGTAEPPGTLQRLVAGLIAAAGIPVHDDGSGLTLGPWPEGPRSEGPRSEGPRPRSENRPGNRAGNWAEDRPGEQAPEADADRWSLTVDDYANLRLEFAPGTGQRSDPRRIADIAGILLTGTPGTGREEPAALATGLKEAAGLLLRARGLRVELNAYVDDDRLELGSDVSATTAGTRRWDPDVSGAAYISDDGSIDFARPFTDPDPAAAARAIAATVTAAVRAR